MRSENSASGDGHILSGRITISNKSFFPRRIPIVLNATESGIRFTSRRRRLSARLLPYSELHLAVVSNFLGRKKLIIYADSGVEAIRCFEPATKLSEFCKYVNENIDSLDESVPSAKYKLTQLEAPLPENRPNTPEPTTDDHEPFLDLLFNPHKSEKDFLDIIANEVEIERGKQYVKDNSHAKSRNRGHRIHRNDLHNLFSKRSEAVWNLSLSRAQLKKFVLGAFAIALSVLAAWQLSGMSNIDLGDPAAINATESPITLREPILHAERSVEGKQSRTLARLISIIQDDSQYQRLIGILKRERIRSGLSIEHLNERLGWENKRIDDIESGAIRADPIDVIDYSVAIHEDLQKLIGSIR